MKLQMFKHCLCCMKYFYIITHLEYIIVTIKYVRVNCNFHFHQYNIVHVYLYVIIVRKKYEFKK